MHRIHQHFLPLVKKNNYWNCNSCRSKNSSGSSHYCHECDYDFCQICMKKAFNEPKSYGHPHKIKSFKNQYGFTCDRCKKHGEHFFTRFRCEFEECDFDLCFDCRYG